MEIESNTAGIQLKTRRAWLASSVELLSSMRFSISLLCMIAISAIIGTVMKQNEPASNYMNQFGPFWFEFFQHVGLYTVYSSWWFLSAFVLLVTSTSLCLWRNAPKMFKDMRSWRENVREQALHNFHHKAEWQSGAGKDVLVAEITAKLHELSYKFKVVQKEHAVLIAAKQGAGNKWGYIFAHAAIVIICLGASVDSDLSIYVQTKFMGKAPYEGNGGYISEIPEQHRLSKSTPTFRGNLQIPEGANSSTAIIAQTKGFLLQELPFTIQLNTFHIDFYSTGMPKLFASDVTITDHETGKQFPATIKVNHPLVYKGIAVFQSSFNDGGSHLQLKAHALTGSKPRNFALKADVGGRTQLTAVETGTSESYSIEWSDFRSLSVENMARNGQDLRAVNTNENFVQRLRADLDKHSGSAGKNANNKDLKNVGPSMQYWLRDNTGQAREFHSYMLPVLLDGSWVFLAGKRDTPNEQFSYLRIPADDKDSVDDWMRLRAALADPSLRAQAAQLYAQRRMPLSTAKDAKASMLAQFAASTNTTLATFAGEGASPEIAGYAAIARFLEKIPKAEQQKAASVFIEILNGSMWDLWQLARQKDGLPALEFDEKHARFLQVATSALSDAYFYGAPVYLQLTGFDEVKASVFQVTRSPGQSIVYIGCLFLVIGVFSMFYIRERRLWIWIKEDVNGTRALMALSSQRKTLDFERDFETLKTSLVTPMPPNQEGK